MLLTLHKISDMYFPLLGTNGFHVKVKNEGFTAASSHLLVDYVKNCSKKRVARAARILVLIQPIISLICGVVVALADKHGIIAKHLT